MKKYFYSSIIIWVLTLTIFALSCDKNPGEPTEIGGTIIPPPPDYSCHDVNADWSNDGWIAFLRGKTSAEDTTTVGLYKMRSDGTDAQLLFENLDIYYLSWSPDGEWIAFSWHGMICKISSDGSQLDTLTIRDWYWCPSWSPDGDRIAFDKNAESHGADSAGIWIMDSSGRGKRRIFPYCGSPYWVYPDSLLFRDNSQDSGIKYGSICIGDTSGNFKRIILERPDYFQSGLMFTTMHPLKRIMIFNPLKDGEFRKIWRVNSDGTELTQLTTFPSVCPSLSPDGEWIIYTDIRVGNGYLWIMDINGFRKRQLTGIE